MGASPGTLAASEEAEPTEVHVIRFGLQGLLEHALEDGDELPSPGGDDKLWLDVRGLADVDLLQSIGTHFRVHPLALEDVVNVPQRPKAEVYEQLHDQEKELQYLFVFRLVAFDEAGDLSVEQLSVVLGAGFVLTFLENHHDPLKPVRKRIQPAEGRLRRFGADYLAYALLDTVVDGYYPVLERIAEELEALEDEIIERPAASRLKQLQRHKRNLLLLRRAVWPQREALAAVLRHPAPLIQEETKVFLRDVHDHTVQIAEVIESYRDLVGELTNTYLSVSSNRMNEVMKLLTVMTSIFIPLTFLAGVYGMNFQHIPELKVPWAYPALLVIMLAIAAVMLIYFWRRGWIGKGPEDD
ncbi:MAG TPA: magnesium/cobalt transporter CorA [Polyangiaceae bacterium]